MRVLHVSYEFPGVTANCGGGGRVTQLLNRELTDMGHQSLVASDDGDGHWATFPVRTASHIRRTISEFDPDIVHGHFSLPSSLALPLLTPDETPLVITVMGADVYDPTRFELVRTAADRVNGWLFEASDAVVTPSTDMTHRVSSRYDADPVQIHHGIDPSNWVWTAREQPEPPTIVSVCRLVERKQLEVGIDAVEQFREREDVDATYRIIGTGPLQDELEAQANGREWLDIAGYVDDLQAALDAADIFLLPSVHEAFGMAVAEGLAAGLPCVTTTNGGQTDLVTDAVGKTAPASPAALSHALARVHDEYKEKQAATDGYIENSFSASLMAEKYESLYESLLRTRTREDPRRIRVQRRPSA